MLNRLLKNIKENSAEYYTSIMLVIAIPIAVSLLVDYRWGLLLSFTTQAGIGLLYIKGTTK